MALGGEDSLDSGLLIVDFG